ncbi:aldehyde ferredoxin oxidoreductase family protein [Thermodesulfobacteriota bacterium]
MYGWAGQRIKVYLTEGEIVREETPEWLRKEYVGGRGFNSRTLFDEVRPGIDPLSPENVFIVGTGPLAGTLAPCGARWTVTAKAPLTDIFADGNGGGHFAAELKFAGYDQIIFYGRSPKPVYLWINNDRVELRDAYHLWGNTTYDTYNLLLKELGDREIHELTIGPAGENQVRFAKVYHNKARAGGKCGMGAVMGSKNLKAVVVRGTGSVKIAKPEEFYNAAKHAQKKLLASPFQRVLKEQGTLYLVRAASGKKSLTTRNSQSGYFEGWEKVSSEAFEAQYAVRHTGCFACPTSDTHVYRVKEGPYATYGYAPEYGTTYPFTSKIGSDNLAAALQLCTICDQLGIDTHSCGGTISFAMEAWQRGLISAKDTDGLDLRWGNIDAVIQLVRKIAYREGIGNLLAEGSRRASKEIKGSEVCLAETKGLECSSYYPGVDENKGRALAFATAPIGGSLHRGSSRARAPVELSPRVMKILGEELGKRAANHRAYEGKGVVVAVDNDFNAALNSVESCYHLSGGQGKGLDEYDLGWLVSAATGFEIDGDGLMKVGERVFNVEKAFNLREGMRRKDDTLSEQFFVEKVGPDGTTGINRAKFEAMLDEYYEVRGWDREGFPTEEKLRELNLSDIAEQLRDLRARN